MRAGTGAGANGSIAASGTRDAQAAAGASGERKALPVLREIHYRARESAQGRFPGSHRSRGGETGLEFRTHAPLIDAPDARRLDLLASLRDPFRRWQVRLNAQRTAMAVIVVADLSASMGFDGTRRKLDVLADLVGSLAWSASRAGDAFSFVGCDDRLLGDWYLPPTRSRAAGLDLARRLRGFQPADPGRGATALASVATQLRATRSLVFLVSDFHLEPALIERTLTGLAHHEVVPVVLWDRAEFQAPASPWASGLGHALTSLHDPESGQERLLWWRPSLRERWGTLEQARREALNQLMRRHRLRPVVLDEGFDADRFTAHFHA